MLAPLICVSLIDRRRCLHRGRQVLSSFIYGGFRFTDPVFPYPAKRLNLPGDCCLVIWNLGREINCLIEDEPTEARQKSGYKQNDDDYRPGPSQVRFLQKIDERSQKERQKNC